MTIYKLPEGRETSSLPRGCIFALGNFDGFHMGHRQIVSTATAMAAEAGSPSAVWTFAYPARAGEQVPAITAPEDKLALLAESGADYAIFEDFAAIRDMDAEEFARGYLTGRLGAAGAVCGFNFRFGRGALGDPKLLAQLLTDAGASCRIIGAVSADVSGTATVVSSTAIRACVADGDMSGAAALLGRPFSVTGTVVDGKRLGRTIGVPTINQNFATGCLIPKSGIYASTVTIGKTKYYAVTNIGLRPTMEDGGAVNAETHIMGYEGDLYGRSLKVELHHRIRGEARFPSVGALAEAIRGDIQAAKRYFGLHGDI